MLEDSGSLRQKLPLWFIICGIAGFLLFVFNMDNAFPSTSLKFEIPRLKIQEQAGQLAKAMGYTLKSKIESTIFTSDFTVLSFLQHNYKAKEADELIKSGLPCYSWDSRFCSPGRLEEFSCQRSPDGKLISFTHRIANDLALPSLNQDIDSGLSTSRSNESQDGNKLIFSFMQKEAGLTPSDFKLLSFKSEKKKSRLDLSYTFEEIKHDYKGAKLRLDFAFSGNELTHFKRYLHVPDSWILKYRSMRSYNNVLNRAFWLLHNVLLAGAFLYFLQLLVHRTVKWNFALKGSSLIAFFTTLSVLVNIPTYLHGYSTQNPELTYFLTLSAGLLVYVVWSFLGNVALFAPAEDIYRKLFGKGLLLEQLACKAGLASQRFRDSTIMGVLFCGIWQGWQNLYFWLGAHFGISYPLGTDNPQIYGSYIPCFDLMAIGTIASLTEELSYRVIFLLVGQRLFRSFWLANFLQAFIWSLGHTTYAASPFWARIVELTVAGMIDGAVFRVYGVIPCIVAHYTFDAFDPMLFKANDWQLVLSGLLAILPPFLLLFVSKCWAAGRPEAPQESALEPETSTSNIADQSPETNATIAAISAPFSWRRRLVLLATLVLIPFCLACAFIARKDPWSIQVSQDQAVKMARDYVHNVGIEDPTLNLCFQRLDCDVNSDASQCLQDKLGKAKFERIFALTGSPQIWLVRFCGEEKIKEIDVQIDACKNRVSGLILRLADSQAGAKLSKAEAVNKVESFLKDFHNELLPFKLVGTKKFDREKRTDYTTQWECTNLGASDLKLRLECGTVGDTVTGYGAHWEIPDKWSFKNREFTVRRGLAGLAVIVEGLLLLAFCIAWLLRVQENKAPGFAYIGKFLAVVAAFITFLVILHAAPLMSNYDSQTPLIPSLIDTILSQTTMHISTLCILGVVLILASDAGQEFTPGDYTRSESGKIILSLRNAASFFEPLCTGYSVGLAALLLFTGSMYLLSQYSTEASTAAYDIVAWLAQGFSPSFFAIALSLVIALVSIPLLGCLYGFVERYLKTRWRFLMASLLASVSVAGLTKHSHDLVLIAALLFWALQLLHFAVYKIFRRDPFSLAAAVYSFMLMGTVWEFLTLGRPLLQTDAFICIAAFLLPFLVTLIWQQSHKHISAPQ